MLVVYSRRVPPGLLQVVRCTAPGVQVKQVAREHGRRLAATRRLGARSFRGAREGADRGRVLDDPGRTGDERALPLPDSEESLAAGDSSREFLAASLALLSVALTGRATDLLDAN
jgi:hypothetical protein